MPEEGFASCKKAAEALTEEEEGAYGDGVYASAADGVYMAAAGAYAAADEIMGRAGGA